MLQQHAPTRAFGGCSSSSSLRPQPFCPSRVSRGSLQVQNAITRQKKEEIVEKLKGRLEDSAIVFGMRFKGLDVPTMQKFRRSMPEKCGVFICKNNLMKVACKDLENWSLIGEKAVGENAWVFVHEDDIGEAVKAFHKFSGDLEKEAKAAAPKGQADKVKAPTELSCAFMDNKYLSPADLKRCENLPSKKQLYATIARLVRQPIQKLAVGIKAVPNKVAYGIKAISELDEDKSKLTIDAVKPKEA